MFKFQRLKVWDKSVELGVMCFSIAGDLPQELQFSAGEQLRRAGLSVSNNIAEGSGRSSPREQSNFYNMAKGSVYEVINIIVMISKTGYLNLEVGEKKGVYELADEICKMLSGLIKRK